MNFLYFLLFLFLVACSQKESNSSIDSSKQIDDVVSQIGNATPNHFILHKDSASMKRYQTFDEYTMCGKGRVTHLPFVYVKRHGDSIFVLSTNKKDSTRLYVKLDNNIWYSHMEYDMWKKNHYIPSKDKLSKVARTYDRFFYNDTLLEVETCYISDKQYHRLFIKCKNDLYYIQNMEHLNYTKVEGLRNIVNNLILSNDKRVNKYTLREEKERYIYEGKSKGDSYSYERKAYGLWGIQPGIEETYLYGGIDIREYSDNLEGYQHDNSDKIYEIADKAPEFPGGTNKFYEFVKGNRDSSLILNDKKPNRVILEVIIEKNGCIKNAKVIKSIDLLHDEDALSIVSKMPNWIPAKLNDSTIRYKMLIPISYR